MKHKWKGSIAMDSLKHFQSNPDYYYNNSNKHMSFIHILIHVVKTNISTTTHILQHQQG